MIACCPLIIPDYIQRSLGCSFRNIPVFCRRLIFQKQCADAADHSYVALGSIRTLLCNIPVRESKARVRQSIKSDFRTMCARVRQVVVEAVPAGSGKVSNSVQDQQWCICLLGHGSTIHDVGAGELLYADVCLATGNRTIRSRRLADGVSLVDEMKNMGCWVLGGSDSVQPLPEVRESANNQDIVTLTGIVDNVAVCMCHVDLGLENSEFRVPSQPLDVHRAISVSDAGVSAQPTLLKMVHGFYNLWRKSFDSHGIYWVD